MSPCRNGKNINVWGQKRPCKEVKRENEKSSADAGQKLQGRIDRRICGPLRWSEDSSGFERMGRKTVSKIPSIKGRDLLLLKKILKRKAGASNGKIV